MTNIETRRSAYEELISDMNESINGMPKQGSKVWVKKRFGTFDLFKAIFINNQFHLDGGTILEGSMDVSYWKYVDAP